MEHKIFDHDIIYLILNAKRKIQNKWLLTDWTSSKFWFNILFFLVEIT